MPRLVCAVLLFALAGCHKNGGGTAVADATTAALLRWNEYESSFVPPARRAWNGDGSRTLAAFTAHHNGYDLFLPAGQSTPLRGKFHYGDLRLDLAGEDVGLWVRRAGAPAWTYVADATTDSDGRVSFDYPSGMAQPGTYFVKMVVYGDLTAADMTVRVPAGPAPAVLFDIDGTLTTSDWEMVKEILNDFIQVNYVPRMHPGANKVAVGFAKAGYEIVYLTARPYWLTRESREWLKLKGFPLGTVIAHPSATSAFGQALSDFKRDRIEEFEAAGAQFAYAFGNATTDISAYDDAGLAKSATWIIGSHAGEEGTVALASYTSLYGVLVPPPAEPYRVVMLVIDGLRADALTEYMLTVAPGDSALVRIFGTRVEVAACETTAPSVTFAGHAAIVTGRTGGANGVPANAFYDRARERSYGFTAETWNVEQVVATYLGDGLANRTLACETLYDQMSASGRYGASVAHMYWKGGEYMYPSLVQLPKYLSNVRAYDKEMMDKALERLDHPDRPDLLTIYLPGLDHEAHGEGDIGGLALDPTGLGNTELKYLYEVVDPQVARLEGKLGALGLLDSTVFIICSDHGHRDLVDDDAHAIGLDPLGLSKEFEKVVEDSPYNDVLATPFFEGAYDSHVGLNGGLLNITLRNLGTNVWQDSPRFDEDVLAVVGSIQRHRIRGELENAGEDAVEEVLVRTDRDAPYQVVRPTRVAVAFSSITVIDDGDGWFGGAGEATYTLRVNKRTFGTVGPLSVESGDVIPLATVAEVDAMGGMSVDVEVEGEEDDWWIFSTNLGKATLAIPAKTAVPSGPVTVTSDVGKFSVTFTVSVVPQSWYSYPELPAWGHLCPLAVMSPEYAGGPRRINEMAHRDRSGDIIVLPRWRQGYSFGNRNKAGHGSLYPEDSHIAFLIGGRPVTASRTVAGGSVVDIAATASRILGIDLRGREGVSRVTKQDLPLLPD